MKRDSHNNNSLILFGAGASYGSDSYGTPPLSADLFSSLRRFNPEGWGRLDTALDELFIADFERAMERLPELASSITYGMWKTDLLFPLQKVMGLYFFTFIPDTTNLYVRMAKKIRASGWRGMLVTLNYERLLEISLRFNHLDPVVGVSPKEQNQIELCFPHGCCNLFCEHVMTASFSHPLINELADGPIVVVNCPLDYMQRLDQCRMPPVMSFFTADKISASGGLIFLRAQRERYEEAVLNAEKIAIVGVRVRPHDKHIWDPLAKTSAKIIYCGGPTGAIEFTEWQHANRFSSNHIVLDSYLAEGFEELSREIGLD